MGKVISPQRHGQGFWYQQLSWTDVFLLLLQLPWGNYFFMDLMFGVAGKEKMPVYELIRLFFAVAPSVIVLTHCIFEATRPTKQRSTLTKIASGLCALASFTVITSAVVFWIYNDVLFSKCPWPRLDI